MAETSPILRLDHLAICAGDLEEGVAWAEAQLGLRFAPGGQHDFFATHNRLLRLGDIYLEVIAPLPGAQSEAPRWFGLDNWQGPPRLANWICRCADMDQALAVLPEAGRVVPLARGDLRWSMAVPENGALPAAGALPSLIAWHSAPPLEAMPDSGARLLALEVQHPAPQARRLRSLIHDTRLGYARAGEARLRARIATPAGEIIL